jgi:hypothetical protein
MPSGFPQELRGTKEKAEEAATIAGPSRALQSTWHPEGIHPPCIASVSDAPIAQKSLKQKVLV